MHAELKRPTRVMLVAGYRIALFGLYGLVQSRHPFMEVVAQLASFSAALESARETRPDVAVLDVDDAPRQAEELVAALVRERGVRVVVVTGEPQAEKREAYVLRGASGVVCKHEAPEILLKAIEKVAAGERWLDRSAIARLFAELSRPAARATRRNGASQNHPLLTAREREIIAVLANDPGADNRRLAQKLNLGEHTVRNHLSRIYGKLGVANRTTLYVFAAQHFLNRPSS